MTATAKELPMRADSATAVCPTSPVFPAFSARAAARACAALSIALALAAVPAPSRAAPAAAGQAPAAAAEAPAAGALHATAILTDTRHVEDIAVDVDTAWVATRGGLEVYGLLDGRRRRLYTTADGLAENHVHQVRALAGRVEVRTRAHRCQLAGERLACVPAPELATPEPALAARFQDARVTARAGFAGGELIGTAAGLWLRRAPHHGPHQETSEPELLTPAGQVCSNHVMAMAEFRGALYLGSFDEGVCVTDGAGFRRLDTSFRMINDMLATPAALFVAASDGLYRSDDGVRFERVALVTARGVNGLAFDGTTLYATTPATLWRIPLAARDAQGRKLRFRQQWLPGGARAIQKVAVGAGAVWLSSEDRGVLRVAGGKVEILDRASGWPTSWVMDAAVAGDHTLYAATFRHGLVAVTLDGAGRPQRESARLVPGLPDTWMLRVHLHQGALWVGTQQGAARIDDGRVVSIQGLPHPCVHAVAIHRGQAWLATEGGLALVPAP
jgi:ligand-binding sensor domain-containing protein